MKGKRVSCRRVSFVQIAPSPTACEPNNDQTLDEKTKYEKQTPYLILHEIYKFSNVIYVVIIVESIYLYNKSKKPPERELRRVY